MKIYNKICIIFILITLYASGCMNLSLYPEIAVSKENQSRYDGLAITMTNENKGSFFYRNSDAKIKFSLGSKVVNFNGTNISLNNAPSIIQINKKFLFFNYQVPALKFDNLDVIDTLLNSQKYSPAIQTIVIDAGHGGKDPGAVGKNHFEKNLNLAIAINLKKELEKLGKTVFLTRTDDSYLKLSERTDFVKNLPEKADLFISIHQNASTNLQAEGIETYFPERILTSKMSGKDKFNLLIAYKIQANLAKLSSLQNRGAKPANFYVLKNNSVPAILIECGFISNEKEEIIIASTEHHSKIIEAIIKSLE